jgi:hypothetical protein
MRISLLLLALFTTQTAFDAKAQANNAEAVKFVLETVRQRGFPHCERAIRTAFAPAGGDNIRVVTAFFEETKHDSISITATWGSIGDPVVTIAEVRSLGTFCVAEISSVLHSSDSCTRYLAENKRFWTLDAETVGVLVAKNTGGATQLLIPAGGGCTRVYRRSIRE